MIMREYERHFSIWQNIADGNILVIACFFSTFKINGGDFYVRLIMILYP